MKRIKPCLTILTTLLLCVTLTMSGCTESSPEERTLPPETTEPVTIPETTEPITFPTETTQPVPETDSRLAELIIPLTEQGGTVRHSSQEQVFPISERNRQMITGVVEECSWTRLEEIPQLEGRYVEFIDQNGTVIRFHEAENCIVYACTGDEEYWWEATPLYSYSAPFESVLMFYYTSELNPELTPTTAGSCEEAAELLAAQSAERYLHVIEESCYYALEYKVLRVEGVESLAEDENQARGLVWYAIRQPKLNIRGFGNVEEGTGELEGWLVMHIVFIAEKQQDGTWLCTSAW